jgi:hypothetical protein
MSNARQRAHAFKDPESLLKPAGFGGGALAMPKPLSKLEHKRSDRMRRTILVARTLSPELYLGRDADVRIRQKRRVRGIHALLMHHHGVASKLLAYQHLPRFMPEPKANMRSVLHPKFYNPPFLNFEARYSQKLSQAICEGKKGGLWEVVVLPEDAVRMVPPGRPCGTCGMWLSPGVLEAQRNQPPCVSGGGSSIQNGS